MSTLIHSRRPSINMDAAERIEKLNSTDSIYKNVISAIHFGVISVATIAYFLKSNTEFLDISQDLSAVLCKGVPILIAILVTIFKCTTQNDVIQIPDVDIPKNEIVVDEITTIRQRLMEKEREINEIKRRYFEDSVIRRMDNLENRLASNNIDPINETLAVTVNDSAPSNSMEVVWSVTSNGVTEIASVVSKGHTQDGRTIKIEKNKTYQKRSRSCI